MSTETIQTPLSQPRTRPRAATDRAQAAKTASVSSRRSSQAMSPPTIATGRSPDIETPAKVSDQARARATSGPLRQPKPLSPSDIHSILEQEQEAMVNRLSRELSTLRHRTSSIASTASSTSTTLNEPLDALHGSPYIAGPIYPTASRRHRSSSNLSASFFPVIQGSRTNGRGRRPSLVSPERSQSLISVTSQHQERKRDASAHVSYGSRMRGRRSSLSQRMPSGSSVETTSQGDVESLVQENDALRRRIRDLELELSVQKSQALSLED
ncbi:uncharacterized protein APUU_11049S [Aspergillus puulaauensis]|uniref:Uncharacterized protein n=1 Tax=Aspergillus puulaauensis TaxID=1220207 RepID=A0A7R8AGR0_9EURO|nr:uncharacterized protein APUU_11049S [Aspergillus puulaauensis]BCS18221.1 hypothetical protein APUU_11049S [Aspergillus puulaauensis]